MNRPPGRAAKIACLLYIALLWAGSLPAQIPPLDRTPWSREIRLEARRLLRALLLSPGDVIFTGSTTEWKLAANCLQVTGRTDLGGEIHLYENECPNRRGPRLRNPPFDQVLQEMTRVRVRTPLRPGSQEARNLRDIAAYFCHLPLETHPRVADLEIRQVMILQSSVNGTRVRNAALHCSARCDAIHRTLPDCGYRGTVAPL